MQSSDLDEGMAHLQAGRWDAGVRQLRRVLEARPEFAEVWANVGYGLRELGRLDEARAALERAVGQVQRKVRHLRDVKWRERYLQSKLARDILAAAATVGLELDAKLTVEG